MIIEKLKHWIFKIWYLPPIQVHIVRLHELFIYLYYYIYVYKKIQYNKEKCTTKIKINKQSFCQIFKSPNVR